MLSSIGPLYGSASFPEDLDRERRILANRFKLNLLASESSFAAYAADQTPFLRGSLTVSFCRSSRSLTPLSERNIMEVLTDPDWAATSRIWSLMNLLLLTAFGKLAVEPLEALPLVPQFLDQGL